jgi:hypothetical protein
MCVPGDIYLGTVCLERTRWGKREPSFLVSDWLPRVAADGFDGVELWENHFLAVNEAEQKRLVEGSAIVGVYNSYAGFEDLDAAARERSLQAVVRLGAPAVKYNLGADAARLPEYRRNLLAWVEQLPADCRALCECHPGTVLERVEDAAAFFADLDPVRFGVITHASGEPDGIADGFSAFGARIQHLHVQLRGPEDDPAVCANRERLDACFEAVKCCGFEGSVALEFTRGIGKDEDIETLYTNVCVDLAYCREALS